MKNDATAASDVKGKPRFDLVKENAEVLWVAEMYGRKWVETATVLRVDRGVAMLLWLDGHSSRNDDVKLEDLLSVYDKKGPEMKLANYSGPGHILPAGEAWLKKDRPMFQPRGAFMPKDLQPSQVFSSLEKGMAAYPDIERKNWREIEPHDVETPEFVDTPD